MHTSTAAGPLPASPSPPEAASLDFLVDVPLRFAVIMLVLLAAAALPQSSFFSITGIDVRGTRQVSAEDIITRSGVHIGDPRFAIRATDVAARVRSHPRIASAQATVEPSGWVRIVVTERRPIAAVAHRSTFLLVDSSGVLVEKRSDSGLLPVLHIKDMNVPWVKLGEEIPTPQIGSAIRVLQLLPESVRDGPIQITIGSSEEFSIAAGDLKVLLGPMRGLGERAALLPQVLSAIGKHNITPEYVDLRLLDHVVVKPVTKTSGGGDGR